MWCCTYVSVPTEPQRPRRCSVLTVHSNKEAATVTDFICEIYFLSVNFIIFKNPTEALRPTKYFISKKLHRSSAHQFIFSPGDDTWGQAAAAR